MRLSQIAPQWDLVIVGGGVTGAGVFREAVRTGLRVLLVEQNDFAWGTSSRSSKMVHGGLRYLKEGQFRLTRMAVRERERLLVEAPGLVEPLEILVPLYGDHGPSRRAMELGLSIYGMIAHQRQHSYLKPNQLQALAPEIRTDGLQGGFRFWDAQVDDARLVQRLIQEGCAQGGTARNYTRVTGLRRDPRGQLQGVDIRDSETGEPKRLETRVAINATGIWAEGLHPSPDSRRHLRALRGSHLIFPARVLPVGQTVSFFHPADGRPVFVFPWEGAVLVGTTDVDHDADMRREPAISATEARYLMDALRAFFPNRTITTGDCLATLAGVRPVLSEGKKSPSEESRDNVVWIDKGLVTVTGGKLTTFRKMAVDTLKAARPFLPLAPRAIAENEPVFTPVVQPPPRNWPLAPADWRRLTGRYGALAVDLVEKAALRDLAVIPGTRTLWAEIPHAAACEQIRHLADLLLRRVRIGLLTPRGGQAHLERIQHMCQPLLDWDSQRWNEEKAAYLALQRRAHGLPEGMI